MTRTTSVADLYLDLLARTLTRAVFEDNDWVLGIDASGDTRRFVQQLHRLSPLLQKAHLEVAVKRPYLAEKRQLGRDWPARAETMAGLARLANVRFCIESVLADEVPGDLIETGVWRGGMSIYMRGVLKAHGVTDRKVWLADSFEGLPQVDPTHYPADSGLDFEKFDVLSVGVEEVRRNFQRYELLDDQVEFIVGWFKDTLSDAPVSDLAVLRLDGDLYESTIQALEPLYPKLSVGGYCIIDDYGAVAACKAAVTDYRKAHAIEDEISDVDGWAVYWRKSSPVG